MKKLIMLIAIMAMGVVSVSAALAADQPPYPVPGNPVAYPCPEENAPNSGVVAVWDDQFYPIANPLCGYAFESFWLCLNNNSEFDVQTPDAEVFGPDIVSMYVAAGVTGELGRCKFSDRNFPMCYAKGPNSIKYVSRAEAVAGWGSGELTVPVASLTAQTNYVVGKHHLTCAGGTPTGRTVSTGNGGEVVVVNSVGQGLLRSNPLDYTIEVA